MAVNRKKNRGQFVKGHKPYIKPASTWIPQKPDPYIRLTENDFNKISVRSPGGKTINVHDAAGRECPVKLLRPKPNPPSLIEDYQVPVCDQPDLDTYRFVHPRIEGCRTLQYSIP